MLPYVRTPEVLTTLISGTRAETTDTSNIQSITVIKALQSSRCSIFPFAEF